MSNKWIENWGNDWVYNFIYFFLPFSQVSSQLYYMYRSLSWLVARVSRSLQRKVYILYTYIYNIYVYIYYRDSCDYTQRIYGREEALRHKENREIEKREWHEDHTYFGLGLMGASIEYWLSPVVVKRPQHDNERDVHRRVWNFNMNKWSIDFE